MSGDSKTLASYIKIIAIYIQELAPDSYTVHILSPYSPHTVPILFPYSPHTLSILQVRFNYTVSIRKPYGDHTEIVCFFEVGLPQHIFNTNGAKETTGQRQATACCKAFAFLIYE